MPIDLAMSLPPELLQFAGSLFAILVLAWLVKRFGLGQAPLLQSDTEAALVAAQVSDGFSAKAVARDASGRGALLRDGHGRIMLLKAHGVHFAGRILSSSASAQLDGSTLLVRSGERRFGDVTLTIGDASSWADAINALDSRGNA